MNLAIDLNTIVSGLALAAILYVARTVTAIDRKQAVSEERADSAQDYARETRERVAAAEEDIDELKVDVASLKQTKPRH
jgi:predicted RNA methylase